MRTEIAVGSPLLKERLKQEEAQPVPAAGFSDLFTAACTGESSLSGAGSPASNAVPGALHYLLALEYIFEGYLLHYGEGRLLEPSSGDFNLLAGDYMYARGLDHIARLNDPACIKLFAGLVSLCSFISCEKLQPELALRAWGSTALCLAAHAAGGGEACLHRFEEFKQEVWRQKDAESGNGGAKTASGALEDLLHGYSPEASALLGSILSDIYSHHAL